MPHLDQPISALHSLTHRGRGKFRSFSRNHSHAHSSCWLALSTSAFAFRSRLLESKSDEPAWIIKWKQSDQGQIFRKKVVIAVRCKIEFWVSWYISLSSSATWWRVMSIFRKKLVYQCLRRRWHVGRFFLSHIVLQKNSTLQESNFSLLGILEKVRKKFRKLLKFRISRKSSFFGCFT